MADNENFIISLDTQTGARQVYPELDTVFTVTIPGGVMKSHASRAQRHYQKLGGTIITDDVALAPRQCASGDKLVNGYTWFDEGAFTWHHLLPQEFIRLFPTGIDIGAAEYGVVIKENTHAAIHWAGWNKDWQDFFKKNKQPSKQEVLKQLSEMCVVYHGVPYAELPTAQQSYDTWKFGKNYVPWSQRNYY